MINRIVKFSLSHRLRYQVHLFGKGDSPCVAMAAIFLQALKHRETFPEAFQTIAKASLVDDMADSRPTQNKRKQNN
jgi:hypothetical protein